MASALGIAASTDAARWDAQAEYDIGVMVQRYLHDNPPIAESEVARLLTNCAGDLEASGERRLLSLGYRRLRSVGGSA